MGDDDDNIGGDAPFLAIGINDEITSAPIPSARQEIIHHFSRRFPQSNVVVAFALVRELCDPLSALQHPSLGGEKLEDYSTYFLAPGIWAVVGVCGPAEEGEDNDPTNGAACAAGRSNYPWSRSEEGRLRKYVEDNLAWPKIAKELKRTERAVHQHWKQLGAQQQDRDEDDEDEERRQNGRKRKRVK